MGVARERQAQFCARPQPACAPSAAVEHRPKAAGAPHGRPPGPPCRRPRLAHGHALPLLLLLPLLLAPPRCAGHAPSPEGRPKRPKPHAAGGPGEQTELFWTALNRAKSVVNAGDPALWTRVGAKLRAGECLDVRVLGGSVTHGGCGKGLPHVPPNQTWPAQLERLLNRRLPCTGGRRDGGTGHTVANLARSQYCTPMWINTLVGQQETFLEGADAVLVETAINDLTNQGTEGADTAICAATEVLLAMLLHRSRRVDPDPDPGCLGHDRSFTGLAVAYVGATAKQLGVPKKGKPLRAGLRLDAMRQQLPAVEWHGVPYISISAALGPFVTPESHAFLSSNFKCGDDLHPSPLGHSLVAEMLLHWLAAQHEQLARAPEWQLPPEYCTRQPTCAPRADVEQFLDRDPATFALAAAALHVVPRMSATPCEGWEVYDDVPDRVRGLIADEAGATCVLFFDPQAVAERMSLGELDIVALKSYDKSGILAVRVLAATPSDAADLEIVLPGQVGKSRCVFEEGQAEVIGELEWDLLWDTRASLPQTTRLQLPRMPLPEECLFVELQVKEAGRKANKVKVIGLTFF
ncbi:hypothetical protein HYH03_001407 [Edaphochlamys debaryana]|uniref:Uncharacterized protein n=1 Tax=Edaphochlamys debaryana TaxID=47281 RepID=A0A835YD14_9CHLO|nr:hypothetical protein HYH03_001407 [Edaphochlamys debaryana]|eukprot:KAG2500640.1 hypothetical protein HYH03_001407 [Edaphochlamys debaryana]